MWSYITGYICMCLRMFLFKLPADTVLYYNCVHSVARVHILLLFTHYLNL